MSTAFWPDEPAGVTVSQGTLVFATHVSGAPVSPVAIVRCRNCAVAVDAPLIVKIGLSGANVSTEGASV